MERRIIECNGRLVELDGNKPVRVLSPDEEEEVRRISSPAYKIAHLSNQELLDRFIDMVTYERFVTESMFPDFYAQVVLCRDEILYRMNKHQ